MVTCQIVELPANSRVGYQPYGGALKFWHCKDHEVIIAGPAETGKTRGALEKIDALCWKYPGMRALIVRKTYKSTVTSVVQTYERKVLGAWTKGKFDPGKTPVSKYGGEKPEWYDYPNGARVVVGGMDNADKVLSSEYDVIYVNQSEELELDDWEKLSTRCTGRAGNMPYPQLIGDANPGPQTHWILARRDSGTLTFIESRHEENPTLFDPDTGHVTEQGKRSLAILESLTGARKQRLRYGKWVQAEGAVYEAWDRAVHLLDRFEIPAEWRRFRVIDFGYTNPFVCQWWAVDPDGRLYLYREIYMSGRTVKVHAELIKRLSDGERIEKSIADHDAEDRATLEENGIKTIAAAKDVTVGIQRVQERLKVAGDGKPRLFVLRDSLVERDEALSDRHKPVCTEQEFDSYQWQEMKDGRPVKEEPLKIDDHGMDGTRYGVMYDDNPRGEVVVSANPFYS